MVVRHLALAAVVAVLASGCSGAPDDLDRLPEVGTTAAGKSIRAVVDGGSLDILVVDGDQVRCRARGPVQPGSAVCDDSDPDGTTYVATVRKDTPDQPVCAVATGAPLASERIITPADWPVDLVVSLTSEPGAFAAPCRR